MGSVTGPVGVIVNVVVVAVPAGAADGVVGWEVMLNAGAVTI
jgi:hypothetical protein